MLSSVIDDKPVSSTWLDRLRFSRGLSSTEDDDASGNPLTLDDFLRRNHHTEITGDPATSSASDSPPTAPIPLDLELAESPLEEPGPGEWHGVMNNVLSELFNFGGGSSKSSTIPGKKFPRKQSNPKHCSLETPEDVQLQNQKRDANCLPSAREFATSSRSSYNKKPATEARERRRSVGKKSEGVDEEKEKGEKDLVGFSKSEVTVIDTSFKIWKSEKLVFRRRNVWKVRDKKGKSRVVSSKKLKKKKKKKRKCNEVGDGEITRKSKKMKKISTSILDNNLRYGIEEVHEEPESSNVNRRSSNVNRRFPSKPRKQASFGIHSTKSSEPEDLPHRSLA